MEQKRFTVKLEIIWTDENWNENKYNCDLSIRSKYKLKNIFTDLCDNINYFNESKEEKVAVIIDPKPKEISVEDIPF